MVKISIIPYQEKKATDLTFLERKYFNFIQKTYCPYFFEERSSVLKLGAKEVYRRDRAIVEQEKLLIQSLGEDPGQETPAIPVDDTKFVAFSVNRSHEVLNVYQAAVSDYFAAHDQETLSSGVN